MNSTEKHVKQGGANCPFCQSEEIEGQGFDVTGGGIARQEMVCLDCAAAWADEYALVNFVEIEEPETD